MCGEFQRHLLLYLISFFSSSLQLFLSHFLFYVAIFVSFVRNGGMRGTWMKRLVREGDDLRSRVLFDFCWLPLSLLLLLCWCCCCCCCRRCHFYFYFYTKVEYSLCVSERVLIISFSFVLFMNRKRTKRMGLWLLPLPLIYYICIVNTPHQFRFIYGMDKFSRALQLLHNVESTYIQRNV